MSDDLLEKVALLLVGWLLGLLGPVVVDAIKRRRENALGRQALLTELNELAGTLALAAHSAHSQAGTLDRSFLEWLKRDLEQHGTTPELQRLVPSLRTQLSWDDDVLTAALTHIAPKGSRAFVLQRYPVPLLDARVSAIWSFDTSFQRSLLQIRRSVAMLDDLVQRSRMYLDLTFSKLEAGNYERAVANLNQATAEYARRATSTVELIRSLPSQTW